MTTNKPTKLVVTQALLPCPWCGGQGRTYNDGDPIWPWMVEFSHSVQCPMAGSYLTMVRGYTTEAEATAVWNTRLASTAPASERKPENLPIRDLTIAEVIAEKTRIEKLWDDFRNDAEFEGHGGSPGEWMYERMNEIDTAIAALRPRSERDNG